MQHPCAEPRYTRDTKGSGMQQKQNLVINKLKNEKEEIKITAYGLVHNLGNQHLPSSGMMIAVPMQQLAAS